MSWVIGRAIKSEAKAPLEYTKLRDILKSTRFDVTGGLKMQDTDRHVGYMNNETYRKALVRLRKLMGWPVAEVVPKP